MPAIGRKALLSALLFALSLASVPAYAGDKTSRYYGFEMQGNLVGYMEIVEAGAEGALREITSTLSAKMKIMGQSFDMDFHERCLYDPDTGRIAFYDGDVNAGKVNMGARFEWKDGKAQYTPRSTGETRELDLPEDTVFTPPGYYLFLRNDLAEDPGFVTKSYRILDLTTGEADENVFTLVEEVKGQWAGRDYTALKFDYVNKAKGVSGKICIEPRTGMLLRLEQPNGAVLNLEDPAVVGMIKRADIDGAIFGKVDELIPDWQELTYLKVQVCVNAAGEWVTPESLNVKGQRFEGVVEDNHVHGVLEIEHPVYDGHDAPPFPPDFSDREDLEKYLKPSLLIESDDPEIRKAALEIVEGAEDSWDAARRLARWVGENIPYAIPGGGSAINVYKTREGECGGHSRLLAAFCRAAGIPARLASGCMYTPIQGGSFGQHVWNELFMGAAGWIPVDATAKEYDYLDSGHIRLGEECGFNPVEMKILDYRTKPGDPALAKPSFPFGGLAYEPGKEYTFTYLFDGASIGTETFSFEVKKDMEKGDILRGQSRITLKGYTAESFFETTLEGRPLVYEAKGDVQGTPVSVRCDFSDDQVVEKLDQGNGVVERTIPLKGWVHLIDNNNFSLFAFLTGGLPREEGSTCRFKIFHPSSMQILDANVSVGKIEEVESHGEKARGRRVDLTIMGVPFIYWLDEKGRVIRDEEMNGQISIQPVRTLQ